MATIVTRAGKGSALSHTEMDANFTNLNNDKLESSISVAVTSTSTFTDTNGLLPFPSGTLMLFQQTAAPTGWTKQTTHNDKALRVVSGTAGSGGTNAFSTALNTTFASDSYTLLEADIPAHDHGSGGSHTHSIDTRENGGSVSLHRIDSTADFSNNSTSDSHSTNSGGAHTHTSFGGGGGHSHGISMDIQYVDLIIASKD